MSIEDINVSINQKLKRNFDGRIVRKDLTKKIKEGANVPVYVLEPESVKLKSRISPKD